MNNKPINTALASYGMSGAVFHAPFLLSSPNFRITKVLERTKELSMLRIPNAQIVRSYNDILNDATLDLVVVNTPGNLHYSMTKEALLAGKHVIVEKPFTVRSKEAKELIAIAKERKLVLAVYQNKRLESDFKTLKEILRDNLLGEIKLFESQINRWKPELGNKEWKVSVNPGAGLLYDLGAHLIDQAVVLFGTPKSVFCDLRCLRKNAVVDDYFNLFMDYGGLKVELKSNLLSSYQGVSLNVQGTKASYVKFGNDPQEQMLVDGILPVVKNWGKEDEKIWGTIYSENGSEKYPSLAGSYQDFFQNVYEAISLGKELIIKPEESMIVIRIIELAMQSHKEKRAVECGDLGL